MDVKELVKKSLAFSLGAAAFSAEKLKQFAEEMVERGEMTSDEARQFVDDVAKNAEREKKSIQDWLAEHVSSTLKRTGFVEASRVESLEQRIAELEQRLAQQSGGTQPDQDDVAPCDTQ